MESLVAEAEAAPAPTRNSVQHRTADQELRRHFDIPAGDKLVHHYACGWWKGRVPTQGFIYLTVNHVAFHALILGKESKLLLRWTDVTDISKTSNYLMPDTITIRTRDAEFAFGNFLKGTNEAFKDIQQLTNLAMKSLMNPDDPSYKRDLELFLTTRHSASKKSSSSALKRELDAIKTTERFQMLFQLPDSEKLDGRVECYLWTPFNEKYRNGTLYISQNFACFSSHDPGKVSVVIPFKDVSYVIKTDKPPRNNQVIDAIHVAMKDRAAFVFANIQGPDVVVKKMSGMINAIEINKEEEEEEDKSDDFETVIVGPLMSLFKEDVDLSQEATKEIVWEKHFGSFGRGVSMFRTIEATRLIIKGIPNR